MADVYTVYLAEKIRKMKTYKVTVNVTQEFDFTVLADSADDAAAKGVATAQDTVRYPELASYEAVNIKVL